MSDLFGNEIKAERKRLEKLIEDNKVKLADVKQVAALAKKYKIDTTDLEALIKIADRVLGTKAE